MAEQGTEAPGYGFPLKWKFNTNFMALTERKSVDKSTVPPLESLGHHYSMGLHPKYFAGSTEVLIIFLSTLPSSLSTFCFCFDLHYRRVRQTSESPLSDSGDGSYGNTNTKMVFLWAASVRSDNAIMCSEIKHHFDLLRPVTFLYFH